MNASTTIADVVVRNNDGSEIAQFDEQDFRALRAALAYKIDAEDYGPDTAHARLLTEIDEVLTES